mgnify:CR=1 FL=1
MKDGLRETVGKTITKIVVTKRPRALEQVFLIFSDGTYFEFWGGEFNCAGGVDHGGFSAVLAYAERAGGSITAVYPASSNSLTDPSSAQ